MYFASVAGALRETIARDAGNPVAEMVLETTGKPDSLVPAVNAFRHWTEDVVSAMREIMKEG